MMISACLVCGIALAAYLGIRPYFVAAFEDFQLDLPKITLFASGPLIPSILFAAIVACIVQQFLPIGRGVRFSICLLILVLGALAIATLVVGFVLPWIQLMRALG